MTLQGYVQVDVTPWEDASGGKAIECRQPQSCTAKMRFNGTPAWYDIDVQYFDQKNGASKFRLYIGMQLIHEWSADLQLPATEPNGDSSTRRDISGVALRPGDEIRIEGCPDGGEMAPLDYIEIHPH
jgi:alpha-glucuronidase